MKKWCLFFMTLVLVGCGDDKVQQVNTMKISSEEFLIDIEASGLLRARETTPLNVPQTPEGKLTIAWLAPEGSFVRKDEPLIRFDDYNISLRAEEANNKLHKVDIESGIKTRENGKIAYVLGTDLGVTRLERDQAETFAPKDETLFSKTEIIDSQISLEFLDKKIDHFEAKTGRHGEKSEKDDQLLNLEKKTSQLELSQLAETRSQLEVVAPHDGFFYLEDSGWFQVRLGSDAWPGMKLGELPNLESMEARVYVLEEEASGLEIGLEAKLQLDAAPGREFKARVKTVDALAKPIERGSPVKYFEVLLSIEEKIPQIMRPGSSVTARIFVARHDSVIAVPNQTLFRRDQETWVYLKKGHHFVKQPVVTGQRGVARTLITEGLEPGQEIALSLPDNVEES